MTAFLNEAIEKGLYEKIDSFEDEMVDELGKLIEIPSLPTYVTDKGMNHGPEIIRCLHHTLDLCKKLGFKTHNEDDYYGWAEIGDKGPLVSMFLHLDVVPVGDGWSKEPFKMTRDGDYLYGRGTIDNKGPAISCIYALKSIYDYGFDFPCRIRIWFGTNEESGMKDARMYIEKYGAPDYAFVPDSQFPLSYSELGGTRFILRKNFNPEKIDSDIKLKSFDYEKHVNGISKYCTCILECRNNELALSVNDMLNKYALEHEFDMSGEVKDNLLTIVSKGKVAYHWDEPDTAINSISHVVMFLSELDLSDDPNCIIRFVANKIGDSTDGKGLNIADKRKTGELKLGLNNMILDEFGLSFEINILHSAELHAADIYSKILEQTKDDIMVIVRNIRKGFFLDPEMPLLKACYESYCEVTGNNDPIKVCGGTYAKVIPNAVPFGAIFGPEQDICHTPDEHIRVETELMVWTKIYANALLRIADNIPEWSNNR